MSALLESIYYYPVKSLSGQRLDEAMVEAGCALADDRRFAILHSATAFDSAAPAWKPKSNFLHLTRQEKLASLDASYDRTTAQLTLKRAGKTVARGQIDTPTGRLLIDQFLCAYMEGAAPPGPYKLMESHGLQFADIAEPALSIINLASVGDLARITARPVEPLRFRGNLHLVGLAPWAEAGWVGKRLRIGAARFEVFKTIDRCAATEVNPASGERDMTIIKALKTGFGHVACGVYARVIESGAIKAGDPIILEPS
jgi:uncharacterized protein